MPHHALLMVAFECGLAKNWRDNATTLRSGLTPVQPTDLLIGAPNGFPAKLQRQGPRAEAARNAGCTFAPRSAAREDCQAACRLPNFGCIRGFSPGTKPGAANFSGELGGPRSSVPRRGHTVVY